MYNPDYPYRNGMERAQADCRCALCGGDIPAGNWAKRNHRYEFIHADQALCADVTEQIRDDDTAFLKAVGVVL